MNYEDHYLRLVARAKGRVLSGYSESHHVKPRCLGGKDGKYNLVELTPEEHFIAHLLLARMYPDCHGLQVAAMVMIRGRGKHASYNSKAFGRLKRAHALATSARGATHYAKSPKSEDVRRKNAASNLGKKRSDETRKRIAACRIGTKASPETVAKMRAIGAARHAASMAALTSEQREAREASAKEKEKRRAQERRSRDRKRIATPRATRAISTEQRAKISATKTGVKQSESHRAKFAEAIERRSLGMMVNPFRRTTRLTAGYMGHVSI